MSVFAEYVWMDGHRPTQKLRSKTKVIHADKVERLDDVPAWGFDGSSTMQADGGNSDLHLEPVAMYPDPIRGAPHIIVMCEVFESDGKTPHPTNTRAKLRAVAERTAEHEPWFGIEQEYTLFRGLQPLGWPDNGFPGPQGPYYCGVGADEVHGRDLVETHMEACLEAGLSLSGINAEVMPGQWEFQVGPVGALEVGDQLWVARYLLYRLGEEVGINATLHPKPVKGDWNGAGAHTNFSTKAMRESGGMKIIEEAVKNLEKNHDKHIKNYGAHNAERLTGLHETCSIDTFRWGVGDRGASIRIPLATAQAGYGYFEDRRPSANMDPYVVARVMLETCVLELEGIEVPATTVKA